MPAEPAKAVEFRLPSLGSDMDQGTVIEWLVTVGDAVHKGDVLLRVDTEKSDIDVEVWQDAVVAEILVAPGDTIPVGTPLARLEVGDGAGGARRAQPTAPAAETAAPAAETAAPAADTAAPAPAPAPESDAAPAPEPPSLPVAGPTERASRPEPIAPSVAVAIDRIGPRLVYWPLPAGMSAAPEPPTRPATEKLSREERRQAAVAALMERSNREIPQFHVSREIDLSAALAWLDEHNSSVTPPERILPAAMLLYATARAAARVPIVNGRFERAEKDGEHVDLAVAVHLRGGGLVTPVLPGADTLPLDTLMRELQAIVTRARSDRMSSRDMTPASITVTNLGEGGADRVLGVIRPPERSLVGFGRIAARPVVAHDAVTVAPTVEVTLTADHRVVNGQAGARFLDELVTLVDNPENFALSETKA